MTRPGILALACGAALFALAGCGSEGDGGSGGSGDASDELSSGPVTCEEGTVGDAGEPAEDDVRITGYDARLVVAADGRLAATEAITVEFDDSEHHGIVRDFDEDLAVVGATGMLDGVPSGTFIDDDVDGARLVLGEAATTLAAGEHIAGISYTADAVREPTTDADQEMQFDAAVVDPGWSLDITDATVTIVLPAEPGDVSCIAGPGAMASIEVIGLTTVEVTADKVPAGGGVRVLVGVDAHSYE